MPLLVELDDQRLFAGDILRLSDNYDTGPATGPVDLLVYDPRDDGYGLGLITASGYKAGLVFCIFPKESDHAGGIGLSAKWLIANWDIWITYTYHPDKRIPVEKALVLRKEGRTLPDER